MKEFFKKIWARIKAFFGHQYVQTAITLILCIALCLGVVFGVRKCNKSMSTVSASAEMQVPESTSNYFNSFLFPSVTEKNGGILYRTSDGAFVINGTFTQRTIFYAEAPVNSHTFSAFNSILGRTVYTWYSSSLVSSYSTIYAEIEYTVDGSLKYGGNTMGTSADLVSGNLTKLKFALVVNAGTYNRDFMYVSVYRNAQSNFYTPSVIGVYETAYNGGYQEGVNTASRGIFKNCRVLVQGSYNGQFVSRNIAPTYLDNGISLQNPYNEIISEFGNNFDLMQIGIIFEPDILIGSIKNFRATGASTFFGTDNIWSMVGYLPNGSYFLGEARMGLIEDTTEVYGIAFNLSLTVNGTSIKISEETLKNSSLESLFLSNAEMTLSQLPTLRFWSNNSDYYVGYDNGYNTAIKSGEAYNNGYAVGYEDGESDGFEDGYSKGLAKAEKFDFAYAISTVLGAPVQVIQEFLDFELLGVDMLGFVSGLFTLMIIVKIIKMIV